MDETPKDYNSAFEAFKQELKHVLGLLMPIIAQSSHKQQQKEEKTPVKSDIDLTKIAKALNRLQPYVETHRPRESKALIRDLVDLAWPKELVDHLSHLREQMKRYNFESALQTLETIKENIMNMKEKNVLKLKKYAVKLHPCPFKNMFNAVGWLFFVFFLLDLNTISSKSIYLIFL